MRFVRALGCMLGTVVAVAAGCSGDPSGGGGQTIDAGFRGDAGDGDAYVGWDGEEPDPPIPAGVPDGWELERTYAKSCWFYVPKTKNKLPPVPTWEPCPPAEPAGADCRLMRMEWMAAVPPHAGYADVASVAEDGRVTLGATRRVAPDFALRVFFDADGPVRNAVLQTFATRCGLVFASIYGDRYAAGVVEHSQELGGGLVAGELDALHPRLAIHLSAQAAHTVYAAPFAVLDLSGFTFHRWSWQDGAPMPPLWSAAQDGGLQQGIPVFTKDAMFWPASNSAYHKVKVYTAASGVRDFLSAGLVIDRGFGDLGTDGKDLVWIEAEGRAAVGKPFDTHTIMTAPFTTEPTQVVAKRLRTEQGPSFDVVYFVVGCGYAARSNGFHIRVVRLSDGHSWILPHTPGAPLLWQNPLALTCTELFATVLVGAKGEVRTARVKLDSLGPGIPPD